MSAALHFLVSEGRFYIGEIIPFGYTISFTTQVTLFSLDFSKSRNSQYIPLMF